MKLLALLALFFSAGASSQHPLEGSRTGINEYKLARNIGDRIVGGQPASVGQFPFQGYLNNLPCGAILIQKTWALTAAHCVKGQHDIKICFGGVIVEDLPVQRVVEKVVIHPDYDETYLNNDLALLHFDPVEFGPNVRPIKLDDSNNDYVGWKAIVSGFGKTSGDSGLPGHLRYTILTVISNKDCEKIYGPNVVIDTTICAGSKEIKGLGLGDSGGPLIVGGPDKNLLIGVASFWSDKGPDQGFPSGFVRINRFKNWINLITGPSV